MRRLGILLVLGTLLTGCAAVGPNTIGPDRFDYGNAIAESWRKQTLQMMFSLAETGSKQLSPVVTVGAGGLRLIAELPAALPRRDAPGACPVRDHVGTPVAP